MSQPSTQYCCIGKGFCGSIWTLEDTRTNNTQQTVIKREDGGPGRSVANDHTMHLQLLQSAVHYSLSLPLSIPKCHELIQNIDSWWESRLPQFPPGYSACRALISERIPKVPRSISDKIVDLFCAGNTPLADFVKSNPDDDACLIRPYLGRRRRHRQEGASQSRFQRFSLRNVPLHVDQMEVLGLDVNAYAETMAEGLAPMYWGAGIDANDVEFVLAPPRKDAYSSTFQSEYLGVHYGVKQACAAFFKNDPFYPRPGTGEAADEKLWNVFKQRFLLASQRIMGDEGQDTWYLADMLVERIEEEGELRRRNKVEVHRE